MNDPNDKKYVLDEQIGYRLRAANQRHLEVFKRFLPEITPTQFAVMVRLLDDAPKSQNRLGRSVNLDAATTNGVIERLLRKGLVCTTQSLSDKRRLRVSLTEEGTDLVRNALPIAGLISQETTKNLTQREASQLLELLAKL